MSTPVLICDDSSFAQKQMARALPRGWDIDISFAADGAEGLAALRAGKGDILFLDLNMPVMDGYAVLEAIRREDLNTLVIVVSGDVQPEARERVLNLGALDFIKKPINEEKIGELLGKFGIRVMPGQMHGDVNIQVDDLDRYQEIANVAMGRAGELLARLLGAFVKLPVPRVNMIEGSDLKMALQSIEASETVSAVCQGFIGAGIAGEALLSFTESSFTDIAALMRHEGEIDDAVQLELLMDISSILIGACLKGIADQLDINFSQGHPIVLGRHINIAELLERNASRWNRTLAIEIGYRIEHRNINCDLMLLFSEDSLDALHDRASFLDT
ncbi:MAG: response regulator [Gammaproteobacteria bacterium]|nr:response regulator [Gammaproteobacteria bacterium]